MDGQAVKVVLNYAPDVTGPRDRAHRRMAQQANTQFDSLDKDIEALKAALESLGATVELPSRGGR